MNSTVTMDTPNLKVRNYYPWIIWGVCALFFFIEYVGRVAPSVMLHKLMSTFQIDALTLTSLSVMFYYTYLLMQMPVGTLVDRYGPKRLLVASAVLCAIGGFTFAFAQGVVALGAGRLIFGFGGAFAFVGTLKLATNWFPANKFGLLAGLTQAVGMLGAAFGEGPFSAIVNTIGWRHSLAGNAAMLLVIAVAIAFVVKEKPDKQNSDHTPMEHPHLSMLTTISIVFRNRQTWYNAMFSGLVYAPSAAFAEYWGPTYLERVHHIHSDVAASAISMLFLGLAVGGPLAGYISDRIELRKPIMIVSAIMSLIFISFVLYLTNISTPILFTLLFFYGLFNIGFATAYAVSLEINPSETSGTSLGFTNMMSVALGAWILQPFIAWMLEHQWTGQIVEGVHYYSPEAFKNAMLALPICLVFGLVFAILVKETHCRNQ